jgi:hypothetical protein
LLERVSERYGELVGGTRVWAGIYAERDGPNVFHAPGAPHRRLGWRIKVLWIMRAHVSAGVVRISGVNLDTEEPLWFQVSGESAQDPTPVLELDPSSGIQTTGRRWAEFPSYLFFPRAGCYSIRATGEDDGWEVIVALGS